ncbi:fimbrial assembly protein [Corticibacter populi]|uniref:Fimbrial assembly protein n=2 Tax=Corticibacter populi TaxID=1550736 RepID=A0A3M6QYA6_9BURK|nr:fimbrial assembly protein [Corticibacter populi]
MFAAGLMGSIALGSVHAATTDSALAQTPLFINESFPPLNMLVLGRDHKLYYEAYNDASDLDGDGVLDVGYKPDQIDYYGYFNNNVCYTYTTAGEFYPNSAAGGTNKKQCSDAWSGDFLNYLATSRMDAIRRVLYGGYRFTDSTSKTVLQAAYIPRDAHTWGKEYDPLRDDYDISKYAPLPKPNSGSRHLFAVTTLQQDGIPVLRVLNDTSRWRIWDWVSKEAPVGQDSCMGGNSCVDTSNNTSWSAVPNTILKDLVITTWKKGSNQHAYNTSEMNNLFSNIPNKSQCGSSSTLLSSIKTNTASDNNPFSGSNGCTQENYITKITGKIYIADAGTYRFGVDGDDSVDVTINGTTIGRYGYNSSNTSQLDTNSKSINFSQSGWYDVTFRHIEETGGDSWGLYWKLTTRESKIVNHNLRVVACPANTEELREDTCKKYPNDGNAIYKPTGLLHDFGENEKMYFGLLTGSYSKNIAGGALRRNMDSFKNEVDPVTGIYKTNVDGIVANIDRLKIIDYSYSSNEYSSSCTYSSNTMGPISRSGYNASNCTMWGNPVAEMMFEAVRYFAGAEKANTQYGDGSKDRQINLAHPDWKSPYEPLSDGGGGYQYCARPVMTVISDINPSYDYKLPGSEFVRSDEKVSAEAARLTAFNVSTETRAIGGAEGITGRDYFIGQSTQSNADSLPTVKKIDDLSNARGLSPEEPSKQGTYFSAGVARFAANNKIAGNEEGLNPIMTYAVAIASPLPQIRFPVENGNYVTISPFAKSVGGGYGISSTSEFQPTNQIVDYYVSAMANTGNADADPSINEGRPYAQFRINYEDVEQGADHDMDAIVLYTIWLDADKKVRIKLTSEYAAGGIIQHMGYVISGTTADGVYLEVRDVDTAEGSDVAYKLNTPPGRPSGWCTSTGSTGCRPLPLETERAFTPSTGNSGAGFLKDPLWYAAKYGMPDRDPASVVGDPDNYFLVTNATTLKDQLTKAFNDIVQRTSSVTAVSVDVPRATVLSDTTYVYRTDFKAEGWSGDFLKEKQEYVTAEGSTSATLTRTSIWSAAQKLAAKGADNRAIYFAGRTAAGASTLAPFNWSTINSSAYASYRNILNVDGQGSERVAFLRGKSSSLRERRKLDNGKENVLGDIVNSSPLRIKGPAYQTAGANKLDGTDKYGTYAATLASRDEVIYIGANDGMLHAFRASDGEELFAFIPSTLMSKLNVLSAADYGEPEGTPHRYYVDGTPVSTDVYFNDQWHKVLIGSLGAGGRQIFALDITNPADPQLLWEFGEDNDSDMGYSLPEPTIARLNDPEGGKGKWVVLLPNGYQGGNSSTGKASLFVLDIQNGSVLHKFTMNGANSGESLDVIGNGLSSLTAVDLNGDAKVDMAYAGDLLGNVWRFDLRSATTSQWSVQRFFTARDTDGHRQPITAAPTVLSHSTGVGDLVVVATGRFLTDNDKRETQAQSIYGVWDQFATANAADTNANNVPTADKGRSALQIQTFEQFSSQDGAFKLSKNNVEWRDSDGTPQKWGWYADFPRDGERQIYSMILYGKSLVFTTLLPRENPCEAGLSGTTYGIDPLTGGATTYPVFDVNGDGVIDDQDLIDGYVVSGLDTAGGKTPIADGRVWTPDGDNRRVASGVQSGRQNWRVLPPQN